MGVICFASLKGGVGKTSAAVNVSHALARRGCETLLIDLDPNGHASRLFANALKPAAEAPLVALFAVPHLDYACDGQGGMLDAAARLGVELGAAVRDHLALLAAGEGLRRLTAEKNEERFLTLFPMLLAEMQSAFDYVVIDTPPDFNVLTRAAVACSALTVVPLDPSAMSIASFSALIASAAEYKEPYWAVLRTMVNRSATRVSRFSQERLAASLPAGAGPGTERDGPGLDRGEKDIFLLDTIINRSEEQNRLSYCGRTALDAAASPLASQYLALARELEKVLAQCEECGEAQDLPGGFWQAIVAAG